VRLADLALLGRGGALGLAPEEEVEGSHRGVNRVAASVLWARQPSAGASLGSLDGRAVGQAPRFASPASPPPSSMSFRFQSGTGLALAVLALAGLALGALSARRFRFSPVMGSRPRQSSRQRGYSSA